MKSAAPTFAAIEILATLYLLAKRQTLIFVALERGDGASPDADLALDR